MIKHNCIGTCVKPKYFEEMSYIANSYTVKTKEYFDKQRVAFLMNGKPKNVTCYDFDNFYARIAIALNVDSVISDVLQVATNARTIDNNIKGDVVSLIGISKHYDLPFFNIVKFYSVAVMLDFNRN